MWLLYASPCSIALKSHQSHPQYEQYRLCPSWPHPASLKNSKCDHQDQRPPQICPPPTSRSQFQSHPIPDSIWRQLGPRHGDVPECTGLTEELLDTGRDGFHPSGKEGHRMASSAITGSPTPPHGPGLTGVSKCFWRDPDGPGWHSIHGPVPQRAAEWHQGEVRQSTTPKWTRKGRVMMNPHGDNQLQASP